MRLSEAIRLGAMLKPQAFGWFTDGRGGSCAMRAASDAIGAPATTERWPVMKIAAVRCPSCGTWLYSRAHTNAGAAMVVHLNDDHYWTREQIADWVETIEQQQEQSATAPVAEKVGA